MSQNDWFFFFPNRFAKYHQKEGYDSRDLIKAYGILFKVEVSGTVSLRTVLTAALQKTLIVLLTIFFFILQGRAFDFVTLLLKLGSMIALLGIVSCACSLGLVKGRTPVRAHTHTLGDHYQLLLFSDARTQRHRHRLSLTLWCFMC